MHAGVFSSPVFVKCGTYVVQEIVSVADAIDLLEEWPEERRDLIHAIALRACYDAHDGKQPVSTARNAFCEFADQARILEDETIAMQWIAACGTATRR